LIIIENSGTVCFNCLKHTNVEVTKIHELGPGSFFDGFNTEIHLCKHCLNEEIKKWLELEVLKNETKSQYLHEKEILDYVSKMPAAGRELFFNRFAFGLNVPYVTTIDWLEQHEDDDKASKLEYTGDSFKECEEVYHVKLPDGKTYKKCPFGEIETTHESEHLSCNTCAHYKQRELPIRCILLENEHQYCELRLKELMLAASKQKKVADYRKISEPTYLDFEVKTYNHTSEEGRK